MTDYFSNAFFHKRISDSFIASQEGPVGKIVATVKCEDLREVPTQGSFFGSRFHGVRNSPSWGWNASW
jgi:hypothetical protein